MSRNRLQKALNDLKKCHKNIQKEIAKIEDSSLKNSLASFIQRNYIRT